MISEQELEAALPTLAATGLPLLVHAELAAHLYQGGDADDWLQYATYLRSRPDEAELAAIRMLIGLCRKYSFPLHIVHLSTALALEDLARARAEGLPVTVETCPHYLHFFAEEIPAGGTLFKCAPPIRSRANREALWQGLRDGIIDLIATDHSPCPPSMKQGDFRKAWGGIASLSVAISVIWTEMRQRGLSLDNLARWMSAQPAKLAGLEEHKGAIATGYDADLVVFDPDAQFTLAPKTCITGTWYLLIWGKICMARCAPRFSEAPPSTRRARFRIHPWAESSGGVRIKLIAKRRSLCKPASWASPFPARRAQPS